MSQKVAIIGAGLAGSLLAIYLAKRGLNVDVYEARGDMRLEEVSAGRSINLALSDRGIAALREIGMDEYMLREAVPMYGRMVHSMDGATMLLPYSGRQGEYINSISRAGLNISLINEAERRPSVRFHFNKKCVGFDLDTGAAKFSDGETTNTETVIATDGAGSGVRDTMLHGGVERFNFSQKWLEHGYKELHIPPSEGGGFLLEKNALHIWPRHQFMMIALPNWDGSFTCTLFLAHGSDPERAAAFDQLTTKGAVQEFFEREFPDAVEIMPTLIDDFFQNPTGNLGTIKCFPWNSTGKALLLGDSAHAVVPFYGQGMNCAFEDVRVLASLIDEDLSDPHVSASGQIRWEGIFEAYGRSRKPNTDAIADMAEENFYEMRDATADPVFQRKRQLETMLEQTYPDYFSKYSMVTFREDLPYGDARRLGNAQDELLMALCRNIEDVSAVDLAEVQKKIKEVIQ